MESRGSKRRKSTQEPTTSVDSARAGKATSIPSSFESSATYEDSTRNDTEPISASNTQNSHVGLLIGRALSASNVQTHDDNVTDNFTEVLESIGLNVEAGTKASGLDGGGGKDEGRMTAPSTPRTDDMDDIDPPTFSSDMSALLTMAEEIVGFDVDVSLRRNSSEAHFDMNDTRGYGSCALSSFICPTDAKVADIKLQLDTLASSSLTFRLRFRCRRTIIRRT